MIAWDFGDWEWLELPSTAYSQSQDVSDGQWRLVTGCTVEIVLFFINVLILNSRMPTCVIQSTSQTKAKLSLEATVRMK